MKKNYTSEQQEQEQAPLKLNTLLKLFSFFGKYFPLVFIGSLLVFCAVWADMSVIDQVRILIDRSDLDTAPVWQLVWPILAFCLVNRICGGSQWLVNNYVTIRALEDLRKRFFSKLQQLSKTFFDTHKTGWLVTRNTGDMQIIGQFMSFFLMMLVIFLTTTGFAFIKISAIAPILLLPALLVTPVFAGLILKYRRQMSVVQRESRLQNSKIVANISETLRGIRVVHAFSREKHNFAVFSELNRRNLELEIGVARLNGFFLPSLDFIGVINLVMVVALGSYLLQQNYIISSGKLLTTGQIVAYLMYMNSVLFPLRMMFEIYRLAIAASAAAERIDEIFQMEPGIIEVEGALAPEQLGGEICFKDVGFRYAENNPWILRNFNLDLKQGETTALVGKTGAGKTTIASLIARFYEVEEGRILLDGVNIRDYQLQGLHRKMGFILQQSYLFSGTVLDNLGFAAPELSREEIIELAKKLGTHQTIEALPGGYDCQVFEGGENFSLGQRQLISITRALATQPNLLIMDEPTSALDIYTERMLQQALLNLTAGRTTIIIAHRLSTVINADNIVLVADGGVRAQGTHEELLQKSSEYAELVSKTLHSSG